MTEEYAFGKNQMDGCKCPALAAGHDPMDGGFAREVAERFDTTMRNEHEIGAGTVPESEARRAWRKMMSELKKQTELYEGKEYVVQPTPAKGALKEAREVADELGWL